MKRMMVLLLIGCVFGLSACGEGTGSDAGSAAVKEESAVPGETAEDEALQEEEAPQEEDTEAPEETVSEEFEGLGPFRKDIDIEETVLYEQNDVKITATGLTYDNYSVNLNLKLENNSDRQLTFIAESMGYSCNAVNEFMIEDGYVNCELGAGESAEEVMDFEYNELLIHGITEVASIQTGFDISDEEYNHFATGPVEVRTALADTYDYGSDAYRKVIQSKAMEYTYDFDLAHFAEDEIYSSGGIRISSEAYLVNFDGNRMLMLEIENGSENTAYTILSHIKVNGIEIYDSRWTAETITSGKKAVAEIMLNSILSEEEWEEYGISEVETIGFTMEAVNEDGTVMAEPAELTVSVK